MMITCPHCGESLYSGEEIEKVNQTWKDIMHTKDDINRAAIVELRSQLLDANLFMEHLRDFCLIWGIEMPTELEKYFAQYGYIIEMD